MGRRARARGGPVTRAPRPVAIDVVARRSWAIVVAPLASALVVCPMGLSMVSGSGPLTGSAAMLLVGLMAGVFIAQPLAVDHIIRQTLRDPKVTRAQAERSVVFTPLLTAMLPLLFGLGASLATGMRMALVLLALIGVANAVWFARREMAWHQLLENR